jgi:hypothetical protein
MDFSECTLPYQIVFINPASTARLIPVVCDAARHQVIDPDVFTGQFVGEAFHQAGYSRVKNIGEQQPVRRLFYLFYMPETFSVQVPD